MQDHRDRPGAKRMALTALVALGGLVAVVLAGGALVSNLLEPEPVAVSLPADSTPVQAPIATAPAEPYVPEPTKTETKALAAVAPKAAAPEPKTSPAPKPSSASGVVVIDAGHQAKGDSSLEPIGPGASERKPKVASGTSGVATGKPESKVNLEVALKLRDELQARGIKVVMVRTSQDVNISNSERAAVANEAGADLFIRLHCDGGASSLTGLSTLIPARNQWTAPIMSESTKAGKIVHKAVIASTGAKDRGVVNRSDLSGFNWAKVPTILIEMGFMSNAAEDRKLSTDAYQRKLADGMADGIVEYLGR